MCITIHKGNLKGEELRIGIVQSRFNENVCEELLKACLDELDALGVVEEDINLVVVPGALEIPSALDQLARTNEFDALIALGAVIKGDTYHFEVVANNSSASIATLCCSYDIPIANAILTTYTEEQALARATEKGRDAARVAVEMANLYIEMTESFFRNSLSKD